MFNIEIKNKKYPTRMGFEPTRAEPIGLAVQRLNHSATSSTPVYRKFSFSDPDTLGSSHNASTFNREGEEK